MSERLGRPGTCADPSDAFLCPPRPCGVPCGGQCGEFDGCGGGTCHGPMTVVSGGPVADRSARSWARSPVAVSEPEEAKPLMGSRHWLSARLPAWCVTWWRIHVRVSIPSLALARARGVSHHAVGYVKPRSRRQHPGRRCRSRVGTPLSDSLGTKATTVGGGPSRRFTRSVSGKGKAAMGLPIRVMHGESAASWGSTSVDSALVDQPRPRLVVMPLVQLRSVRVATASIPAGPTAKGERLGF